MRVLCVEDEVGLREDIAEYLRLQSYEVDEAESGVDAIEQMNRNQYDLVLCDIKMPRMNGYELLRQVRREDHLVTTPFVFLSALNERDDKIEAHEIGCDGYLTKPIDFTVLDATLKSYIERQRVRDYMYSSAYDSAQRHIMALLDDALSGSLSEACLTIEHLQQKAESIAAPELKRHLKSLQGKMSAHVSNLHMFHCALGMQAAGTELISEAILADDLIKQAVQECHYNNPASGLVYQAPRPSAELIFGDARMLQRAVAGLMAMMPNACVSSEVVHFAVEDGSFILTLSDVPEMVEDSDFAVVSETTNLASMSPVTRQRLIPLSYALQTAQAHSGHLEIALWSENRLAVRLVLPQPSQRRAAAA